MKLPRRIWKDIIGMRFRLAEISIHENFDRIDLRKHGMEYIMCILAIHLVVFSADQPSCEARTQKETHLFY